MAIWDELARRGGPSDVTPELVRELRIHRGEQGVYRDLEVTAGIGGLSSGIAVGVLPTGTRYADELSENGVVYHYPTTKRGSHDENERASLRSCADLGLPLFVVAASALNARKREVRLGWPREYDDNAGLILIEFANSPKSGPREPPTNADEAPFSLRIARTITTVRTKARPNQWRFRYDVMKRYGAACAVCEIRLPDLLDAAHICSVEDSGSDDPRNGLVLCLTHHRAFDKGLFLIEPSTLRIVAQTLAADLGITRSSITHLSRQPHDEAIRWSWNARTSSGRS